MRLFFLGWCLLPAVVAAGARLDEAKQMLAGGQYQAGGHALKRAAADDVLSPEDRFEAAVLLARFYATHVGDYARAIRHAKRALRMPGGAQSGPLFQEIEGRLAHWRAMERRHRDLNLTLRRLKTDSFRRRAPGGSAGDPSLGENLHALKQIIEHQPDYHRIHEVYYALGLTYLALERPLQAYRAFEDALTHKPAMDLAQPISRLHHSAFSRWLRTSSHRGAWLVFGALICILAGAGLWSRPWRWLLLRHILVGMVALCVWTLLFFAAYRWLAGAEAAQSINRDGVYPKPVFVHTELGAPGAEVVHYLFLYGLAAISGSFLFAVATGPMINRRRATVINAAFAVLFSAALGTLYYLDFCEGKGRFYPKTETCFGFSDGYLAYPMSDPEPYLLVDPLTYRGLDLSSISDPVLIEWLQSYTKISPQD